MCKKRDMYSHFLYHTLSCQLILGSMVYTLGSSRFLYPPFGEHVAVISYCLWTPDQSRTLTSSAFCFLFCSLAQSCTSERDVCHKVLWKIYARASRPL